VNALKKFDGFIHQGCHDINLKPLVGQSKLIILRGPKTRIDNSRFFARNKNQMKSRKERENIMAPLEYDGSSRQYNENEGK
jgi:hypothetical protein